MQTLYPLTDVFLCTYEVVQSKKILLILLLNVVIDGDTLLMSAPLQSR